jgi:hypothetical protein
LEYHVSATPLDNNSFTITMENDEGGTDEIHRSRTYDQTFRCWAPGAFAAISAQLDGSADIKCTIVRDGLVVSSASSSGPNAIASCSDTGGAESTD